MDNIYLIQKETLDSIADAINAKTGGSSAMTPAEMVTAIGSISVGGEIETEVYTHAENWLNDATGNVVAFSNAYFPKANLGCYIATIENNTASGKYKAVAMFRFQRFSFAQSLRSDGVSSYWDENISFYLSAGSIVKTFFIPNEVIQ